MRSQPVNGRWSVHVKQKPPEPASQESARSSRSQRANTGDGEWKGYSLNAAGFVERLFEVPGGHRWAKRKGSS